MPPSIAVEPLTAEAFAAFGDVLTPPDAPGRAWFEGALSNGRTHAAPSLSLVRVGTAHQGPLMALRMERHLYSSQSFVPLGAEPFLVLVSPPRGAAPDMSAARAFVASGGVGVTYATGVWHHPLTVLRAPASFAVFMWRDGGPEDEEFVDIAPTTILLPETVSPSKA
jgi:ureidoglycolate lyase